MRKHDLQNESQSDKPTLQQIIKEKQKQEAASESMKTRCKICFREIAPQRHCGGHGGGGGGPSSGSGGGGGNDPAASSGISAEKRGPDLTQSISSATSPSISSNEILDGMAMIDEDDEQSFNPEVIADLVEKNLVSIDNDRELETLTIKLLCKPEKLTDEQMSEFTKFVNAIVKQLDDFKEENGISANCKIIERDEKGNILSLRVALPTTKLYDAFIQRLAVNLLPAPNLNKKQDAKVEQQNGINPLTHTPLSIKPTSLANKKRNSVDADKQEHAALDLKTEEGKGKDDRQEEPFNPSPFSTTPKPTSWK